MFKLLLIAIAGGAGTLARYGVATLLRDVAQRAAFPLGTLVVNSTGCFFIGFLQGVLQDRWMVREEYKLAIFVGFLGGYTTFSAFGWETALFIQEGRFARAGMNFLLNNGIGIGMVMAGYAVSRWLK